MGTWYETLKTRQRQERDDYPEDLILRVHRALSWLDRAEQESDPDSRFIFLWIAFNAAYASEIDDRQGLSEQATFNAFLEKLHTLDKSQRLKSWSGKSIPVPSAHCWITPMSSAPSGNTRKAT